MHHFARRSRQLKGQLLLRPAPSGRRACCAPASCCLPRIGRKDDLVEYYSVTHGAGALDSGYATDEGKTGWLLGSSCHLSILRLQEWLPAIVVDADALGRVMIDLRPGVWLSSVPASSNPDRMLCAVAVFCRKWRRQQICFEDVAHLGSAGCAGEQNATETTRRPCLQQHSQSIEGRSCRSVPRHFHLL